MCMCIAKYQVRVEDRHNLFVGFQAVTFVERVMVLSDYIKLRILSLHWQGFKISKMVDILVLEDTIVISRQSIRLFLKRFTEHDTIERKPGSGLTLRLSPNILQIAN